MRAPAIPDDFLEKAPVTASRRRPHGVLTATKALLRSSSDILSRSYGVLVGDSMRSHGAHIVCTVLSRRLHCAFTAFALRFHDVYTALTVTSKNVCKYQELQIQPIKQKREFPEITTCVYISQNTREHIVNRVSSHFLNM